MIVLDLACGNEHRFEGWFASIDAFEDQRARKLLSCPLCSTSAVRRLPSAPHVHRASESPPAAGQPSARDGLAPEPAARLAEALRALRRLAREAENVGERLPEEARRIHYGEAVERSIRGSASRAEVEALLEEGIGLLPVPPMDDELH